jgi:hypothetical protein
VSAPIILVTQDSQGRTLVDWYEDMAAWESQEPFACITDVAISASGRDIADDLAWQIANAWCALVANRRADLSRLATHRISSITGLLEPVSEVAA